MALQDFRDAIYPILDAATTAEVVWSHQVAGLPRPPFVVAEIVVQDVRSGERHYSDDPANPPAPAYDTFEHRFHRYTIELKLHCFGRDAFDLAHTMRDAFFSARSQYSLPTTIGLLSAGGIDDVSVLAKGSLEQRYDTSIMMTWAVTDTQQLTSIESTTINGEIRDTNNPPDYKRTTTIEVNKP